MKKAILASTSTLHGQDYLEYLIPEIKKFFRDVSEVLFIPYARPGGITHEQYTVYAAKGFTKAGLKLRGIQDFHNPVEAIKTAEAIFTGGGNTFLLVSKLYRNKLMQVLQEAILSGTPYLGTSAGTNIAGLTMQTTNDMPIIYPPSFKTMGIVPFNINPHYLDPDKNSIHKGETRETRIKEFHTLYTQPVVGLREGSWLEILGDKITLKGQPEARIFKPEQVPFEVKSGTSLTDLK